MAAALWKGVTRGLIIAVCSFVAVFIGLAAAIKLSVYVAAWIQSNANINTAWLSFLSFAIVMFVVILLVRMLASFLENSIEFALMGWVNKLGGFILYALVFTLVYSVVLFYGAQLQLIAPHTIAASKTYQYIAPFGPKAINFFGQLIPVFKDLFAQLEAFFEEVGKSVPKS